MNLSEGRQISLATADDALAVVRVGLGWRAARTGLLGRFTGRDLEMRAFALLFSGRQFADVVFPQNQLSLDGSVGHTSGYGRGDDDTFAVGLTAVPGRVDRIVLSKNSFTGRTFEAVRDVSRRAHDDATGQELGQFTCLGAGEHTALVMAKMHRTGDGEWRMSAIGRPASGQTFRSYSPP
ncbi:TerD family protein [Streptomyces sp. NPDC057486]|uniref:TerD family protein n=1 Tax=Streptomyces sp. NPDC057486 TaxID=3346145 RepID=UPI00369FF6BB